MKTLIIIILLSVFSFAQEFELKKEVENSTHAQYITEVNEFKFRCNLGVMELNENDSLVFRSKYGNAVILKTDVIDYVEAENEVD